MLILDNDNESIEVNLHKSFNGNKVTIINQESSGKQIVYKVEKGPSKILLSEMF